MKCSIWLVLLISSGLAHASTLLLQSEGTTSTSSFNPATCAFSNMSTCEWDDPNGGSDQTNYAIPQSNLLIAANDDVYHETQWGGTGGVPSWVSYENTGWNFGPSGTIGPVNYVANANCPGANCTPTSTYYEQFTDDSSNLMLSLTIYGDDDVGVYLNGIQIIAPSFTMSIGGACDQTGTGMNGVTVTSLGASVCTNGESISGVALTSGTNTLEFKSYQMSGSAYGLLWNGEVTGTDLTPEPAPLALLGVGLVVLGVLKRKRLF
jgi:hypothetical protein